MSATAINNSNSEGEIATASSTTSTQRTLRPRRTTRSQTHRSEPSDQGNEGEGPNQGQPAISTQPAGDTTATEQTRGRGRGRGRGRTAKGGRTSQAVEQPSRQAARKTGEATNGISASNHPTVPQPIFTFVTAPKVTDISHDGMTRWLDLRLEYEEAIKARCKNTGEEIEAVMTSVRNSFDESLLDTLCEVVWVTDKNELTENFLWDWVMKTVESFKNRTLPNIEDLFQRELSMDESQGDVEAQVTDYFHSCNTLIRTNGLVGLFKTEDGLKKKCKVLVNSLPGRLKKKVKNEIDFRAQIAKSSVPELYKLIIEQALDQEKIDRAVRSAGGGAKRKQNSNEGSKDAKSDSFAPRKRQYQGKPLNNSQRSHADSRQVENQGSTRQIGRSSNQRGCFNCGGGHLVRDCPRVENTASTSNRPNNQQRSPFNQQGRHRTPPSN